MRSRDVIITSALFLLTGLVVPSIAAQKSQSQARTIPLNTRWTRLVSTGHVHPEYPRPQLVRSGWHNLNGPWEYAIRDRNAPSPPEDFAGEILVPFSITSTLSGVTTFVGPESLLWYRRSFTLPKGWRRGRVILHFGAVDWQADVWLNGSRVGSHRGGYTPFSCDVTGSLRESPRQDLLVAVWDPTDAGFQSRGKQVRDPKRIWYTSTTGIWQTVWIENVPALYIESLHTTPNLDENTLELSVEINQRAVEGLAVEVEALDQGRVVASRLSAPGESIVLRLESPKLWSPDSPFLYDLTARLVRNGTTIDSVKSYFGMRKISLQPDGQGVPRLFLNGQALFQYGVLDQGFWPDGLYTPPCDDALRQEIELIKDLGFNMIRKHVKVEPDRWYYWADRLGVLVWQDIPNGDDRTGRDGPEISRVEQSAFQFEREMVEIVKSLRNHPSIVMWVLFNEGWGQYDTGRLTAWLKGYDPTRLVDSASGWVDRAVGDVKDIHAYPGPAAAPIEKNRAVVLGEFGGLGLSVLGHTWPSGENWAYEKHADREHLTEAYRVLVEKLRSLAEAQGLAAAVYTQLTDVEREVNGLMTYDREVIKMDREQIRLINRSLKDRGKSGPDPDGN